MSQKEVIDVAEQKRLNDARIAGIPWKKWGPYLSERQWGTVREDYSKDGNAWDEVANEIQRRLAGAFLRDGSARRPVYGGTRKFQEDPHWRDLILFYEYFHGDNGAGLGASHQTGWTGLIAFLIDFFGRFDAKSVLETDRERTLTRMVREQVGGEGAGAIEERQALDQREPALTK